MPAPLRIVADENIPLAEEAFGTLGTVERRPGRALRPADVRSADAVLVRSVTPVDAALLEGSHVRFVGSATIGTDHVDEGHLKERGIAFAHAPGSNADSVADYVVAALLHAAAGRGTALRGQTVGVVGCGNIGGRLARRLAALGLRVLLSDPPLEEEAEAANRAHEFHPLSVPLEKADVLTLHVPLLRQGPHATHHLIGERALRRMRPGAWLVNTSRGAVVDNAALLAALEEERIGAAMLDVWEDEPTPDARLVRRAAVATPHIAGYAYDGKVRGTAMLYAALCDFLDVEPTWDPEAALAPGEPFALNAPDDGLGETEWLHVLTRQMYDIAEDDARLRATLDAPPDERGALFSRLRKEYPRRREFARFSLDEAAVPPALREAVEEGLSVQLA